LKARDIHSRKRDLERNSNKKGKSSKRERILERREGNSRFEGPDATSRAKRLKL